MRTVACLAVIAIAAPAAAGDDDDRSWPSTTAVTLTAHGRWIGEQSIASPALGLERAWGHGRWQWLVHGRAGWAFASDPNDESIGGPTLGAGTGARWLARSFKPDSSAAIQLYLESGVDLDYAALATGPLVVPGVWFGMGWQIRAMGHHRRMIVRFMTRVELSPRLGRERREQLLCRGACPDAVVDSPIDDAFIGGLGIAW